jgi:23S rRNA U2552 (ribose-2'-O)-methylase RlmE/FtsJ
MDLARQMLKNTSGIEEADRLSILHIEKALECLAKVKDNQGNFVLKPATEVENDYHKALIGLAVKVKTRNK